MEMVVLMEWFIVFGVWIYVYIFMLLFGMLWCNELLGWFDFGVWCVFVTFMMSGGVYGFWEK